MQQGMPAEYADGYAHGYKSARFALTKDLDRYLSDPKYKAGWDDGFMRGKGEVESIRRSFGG